MAALGQALIPYFTGRIIDYASIDPNRAAFQATTLKLIAVAFGCAVFTGKARPSPALLAGSVCTCCDAGMSLCWARHHSLRWSAACSSMHTWHEPALLVQVTHACPQGFGSALLLRCVSFGPSLRLSPSTRGKLQLALLAASTRSFPQGAAQQPGSACRHPGLPVVGRSPGSRHHYLHRTALRSCPCPACRHHWRQAAMACLKCAHSQGGLRLASQQATRVL